MGKVTVASQKQKITSGDVVFNEILTTILWAINVSILRWK
jgi:hypothetical protein